MKLGLRIVLASTLALAAAPVLTGCSGNDGKIEVDTAGSALTDQGNDMLFTIKLVEAREGGYALEGLRVKVTPEDRDGVDVTCRINDANANSKLDQGESLSCVEPAENRLGKDLAGKGLEVELFAKIDGEEERVGDATYSAK